MNIIALILLAFSMSTDAFAAAIAKGVHIQRPSISTVFQTALIFGLVESSLTVLGWLMGAAASHYIQAFDHWVAFVLLGGLGIKMLHSGLFCDASNHDTQTVPSKWLLMMTALGTSVDSMIIGVSLALSNVNVVWAAVLIGFATILMTAIGVKLGNVLGQKVGKRAEIFGGLTLIIIGTMILLEHLNTGI